MDSPTAPVAVPSYVPEMIVPEARTELRIDDSTGPPAEASRVATRRVFDAFGLPTDPTPSPAEVTA